MKRWNRIALIFLLITGICVSFSVSAWADGTDEAIRKLSDLKGKRIAVQTGTVDDALLDAREDLTGTLTFEYFNSPADMIQALETGKADAVPLDRPIAMIYCSENPDLMILDEAVDEFPCGMGFQKGSPYVEPFNEALAELRESGVLDELLAKWTGTDESAKTLMEQDWEAPNGTLRYWLDTTYEPVVYVGENNKIIGYEVDVALHAAQIMGCHLELTPCNFDGMIPALVSGKADMISSGMTITEERAQSIDFSDPTYIGMVCVIVKDPDAAGISEESFLDSLKDSFYRTFVKEDRWKLFLKGIGTTMLITIFSAFFGTILGFGIYLLCRNTKKAVSAVFEFFFSILERMPIIVTLMVLYYIILGGLKMSGTIVSILAFTITFASAMYGMLKMGVDAISIGQTEAGYALGYNKRDTFFKIVLPQAARIFIPSYKSELISLVKGTAVVGYISVQDLTKMGDIVRSRTYEAFFPLITTAVIYLVLTYLLTFFINKLEMKNDPRRRKKEDILKGVQVK